MDKYLGKHKRRQITGARKHVLFTVLVLLLVGCERTTSPLAIPTLLPTAQPVAVRSSPTPLPSQPTRIALPPVTIEAQVRFQFPFMIPTPGIRAVDAEQLYIPPIPAASDVFEWRPPPVAVPHAVHPKDHYWLRRPIPSGAVDWGLDWYPYGGDGGGIWRVHRGMDFPNDPGTPVLAAADGTVIWVENRWTRNIPLEVLENNQDSSAIPPQAGGAPVPTMTPSSIFTATKMISASYGNLIIILHDWGWQGEPVYTLYAHLLEVFVREGDRVSAGDLLAGVGNTGDSTGPHLHFEVRVSANDFQSTRNPALWMAPYEEWGTLVGQIVTKEGVHLDHAVVAVASISTEDGARLEEWRYTTSYANDQVHPDENWQENFVMPDLSAGYYQVIAHAAGEKLQTRVLIQPGITTFLKLHTRE